MVLDVRPEVKIPVLWVLSQEMSAFYSVFKQKQKIQCRKPTYIRLLVVRTVV